MVKSDLFNDESICIFTDSSFKKYDPKSNSAIGVTAPAFCVYHKDTMIEQGFHILHNSTSQQGEIYAVMLGVINSFKYRNFDHIRIFSDNMNAIYSLREWIFKWVEETSKGKKVLGEDGRINNQSYILDTIHQIMENKIFIEFYHVKGHVDIRSRKSIINSKELFLRSNPFVKFIDDGLIFQLAMGNNAVDEYSTVMLREFFNDKSYDTRGLIPGVSLSYIPFDLNEYSNFVNIHGKTNGNCQ